MCYIPVLDRYIEQELTQLKHLSNHDCTKLSLNDVLAVVCCICGWPLKAKKCLSFEIILDSKRSIFANKENFAKEILSCKEKDAKNAKKNIGNKSLILHLFQRKIANIMKKKFTFEIF